MHTTRLVYIPAIDTYTAECSLTLSSAEEIRGAGEHMGKAYLVVETKSAPDPSAPPYLRRFRLSKGQVVHGEGEHTVAWFGLGSAFWFLVELPQAEDVRYAEPRPPQIPSAPVRTSTESLPKPPAEATESLAAKAASL